ncbi:MAG: cysteine hydrolase family protein [Rhizobiaceae bacterium]
MSAKTLLQLAGADLTPPGFSDATLVVIDAQREYVDGALPLTGVEAALDRIAAALAKARAVDAPIVHVQHKGRTGGLFDPDATAFEFAAIAAPGAGETIVQKGLPNAFAGTNLGEVLEKTGRKRLIMAGFMTHMCVSATARAALDLGYQSTVLSDATATRDLPDPAGDGVVSAADLHRAELAALSDRFSIVCRLADLAG